MKDVYTMSRKRQAGAVSLFIVIFAMLLMTVITLSFVKIMLSGQTQTTSNNLSQSALDSANAGVEDGKRAILAYQSICASGSAADCATAEANLASTTCNTAVETLGVVSGDSSEVKLETTTTGSASLDQAYTCVKINLDTPNFLTKLDADGSTLIPLSIPSGSQFNQIRIDWYTKADLQSTTGSTSVNLSSPTESPKPLIASSSAVTGSWPANRPSLLRAQYIQYNPSSFTLSDFDATSSNTQSAGSDTAFLYPSGYTGTALTAPNPADNIVALDANRPNPSGIQTTPTAVTCNGNLSDATYACSEFISLPTSITPTGTAAFLRLTSEYNASHVQVSLLDTTGAVPKAVNFEGVQPEIDSTGRANDLYRRISARVSLTNANFPYPDAALETLGDLCKDYVVTTNTADYTASKNTTCKP